MDTRSPFPVARVLVVAALAFFAVAPARAVVLPEGFTATLMNPNADFANATSMVIAPDGRIFVCEQGGKLRVIKDGALLATEFVQVTVNSEVERGLLGVALDPNFPADPYVYLYYTATTPAIHNRVSRFTANGDVAVPMSESVLLDLDDLSVAAEGNGGALHFGLDGYLYVGVGANALGSNSQTLSNLLGKILRLNKDPQSPIPDDNPFEGTATGNNRAIWALGLRNPFTFAVQPGTGRVFVNDVGSQPPAGFEEINDGIAGSNYGWPEREGVSGDGCPACTIGTYRNPVYAYPHLSGCSAITGGTFYNPALVRFPLSYLGKYFFSELCGGWIKTFDPASGTVADFAEGIYAPLDLDVDANGTLYYLERGNEKLYRVNPPPSGNANGAGGVDVSDVLYLINSLFAGGPAPVGNANANGDTAVNVSDILYLINYLFAGGPAPV